MRFFTGLFLFSGLLLAGCGLGPERADCHTLTVSYLPYVAIEGVSRKLEAGSGVELGSGSSNVVNEEKEGAWGVRYFLAWSRHNAAPGRPEADYFRTGVAMTFSGYYWTGKQSTPVRLGFDAEVGLTFHDLVVDGPGDDVTGLGPSGSVALRLKLGRRAFLAAGVDLNLWVITDWDLVGTIAPFARFGVQF